MPNYKLNRRHFITSTGAVFMLPLLESLFPFSKAMAAAAADPRRYVLFYMPSGTYNRPDKPIWMTANGALSAANTSLALSPFAANYSDITSINYLKNDAWFNFGNYNDEHQQQAAAYATCADQGQLGKATMTSFENAIGNANGKPAFVISAGEDGHDQVPDQYVSYQKGVPNPGLGNPGDLYAQLLKVVAPTTGTTTRAPAAAGNNKSILDSAIADFTALSSTLGTADKTKLNEFMQTIRDLENSIVVPTTTNTASGNAACVTPTIDASVNTAVQSPVLYVPKFQAFNNLIKIAFACDITRSVSVMLDEETSPRTYGTSPSNLIYMGQDINGGVQSHIGISHASGLTTVGYNLAVTRDRVLLNVAMDLANKLKASTDPSGSTMLANTIIQAGFGIEDGNHSYYQDQRPLVLIGGQNMITTGQSYTLNNNQMKDLYFTIQSKMGVGLTNFQGSTTLVNI